MVEGVLFLLEQVVTGVLCVSVGLVGVLGWRWCVALLLVQGLFMLGLVVMAVGR